MHAFAAILSLLTVASSLRFVSAAPTDTVTVAHVNLNTESVPEVQKRAIGCGAIGPFPGATGVTVVISCSPGQATTIEATDATGCEPGDSAGIISFVVTDPSNNLAIGGGAGVTDVRFICPSSGRARGNLSLRGPIGANYGIH